MADPAEIRTERDLDRAAIGRTVTAAFTTQPVVADLVDALRASSAWRPDLSLVALIDGEVVGHVLATRGWLDAPAALVEVLVLSPLSVTPSYQHRGIGTQLMTAILGRYAGRSEPGIFLEGDPAYYARFGFVSATESGVIRPSLRIPEGALQMIGRSGAAAAAAAPNLTGTLVYPDPFWALDCVGLR